MWVSSAASPLLQRSLALPGTGHQENAIGGTVVDAAKPRATNISFFHTSKLTGNFAPSAAGAAESSELIRQVLLSESFWKPATDFHPALVASPRASASSEPRRRRDCI